MCKEVFSFVEILTLQSYVFFAKKRQNSVSILSGCGCLSGVWHLCERYLLARCASRRIFSRSEFFLHLFVGISEMRYLCNREIQGVMLEWLKRHAWKACIRQKRIPSSNLGHSASRNKDVSMARLFICRDRKKTFLRFVSGNRKILCLKGVCRFLFHDPVHDKSQKETENH